MTTTNPTAAALLIASVPVAIWGLLGQDDYQGVPKSELDYAVKPLNIPAGLMTAAGAVALVLATVCAALLLRATHRGRFDGRRWQVVLPLVGAGMIAGFGYRVATAGVIGANIGAGLAVLVGGPLIAVLALVAAVRELSLRIGDRRHRTQS